MSLHRRLVWVLARQAAVAFGGRGSAAGLLIVTYHRVLPDADPLLPGEPDATAFEAQLQALQQVFRILPLPEAAARLREGTLPPRAACLTFDDGYANNAIVALPLLRKHGVPATVFVATGFLDGGRMFNDTVIEALRAAKGNLDLTALGLGRFSLDDDDARRRAVDHILPAIKHLDPAERSRRATQIAEAAGVQPRDDLMMTSSQVRTLAEAGVDVGGHTVTHPILTRVTSTLARAEIVDGKRRLEQIIGRPVRSFAYPNGRPDEDYTTEHAAMARDAGFDLAVSTARGVASYGCDPYQLPRVPIWGRSVEEKILRLVAASRERHFPVALRGSADARAATAPASPAPK